MSFVSNSMASVLRNLKQLLFGLLWIRVVVAGRAFSEFDLGPAESLNGSSSVPCNLDLRVSRINKNEFGYSGHLIITDTKFSDYTLEILIFYKAVRSLTFMKSPMQIRRGNICLKLNNEYRRYMMKELINYSDLPHSDNSKVNLCDLVEMKNYTINKFPLKPNVLFDSSPPGNYMFDTLVRRVGGDEVVAGIRSTLTLS